MSIVRWFGIALFLALGALSVSSQTGSVAATLRYLRGGTLLVPPNQKLIGNVESIQGGLLPSDHVVSGWCTFTNPAEHIVELDLKIDDTPVAQIDWFDSRPDVVQAYGQSSFELSGWRAKIDLGGLHSGPHKLFLHAIANNGDCADLPPVPLKIQ